MRNQNFKVWGNSFSDEVWRYFEPFLREFKELSIRHKFKFGIIIFPVRDQVEAKSLFNMPQLRMRQITEELEVPWLDVLPKLRELKLASYEHVFYDHCHYKPYGNELIADWIKEFLLREYL